MLRRHENSSFYSSALGLCISPEHQANHLGKNTLSVLLPISETIKYIYTSVKKKKKSMIFLNVLSDATVSADPALNYYFLSSQNNMGLAIPYLYLHITGKIYL